jgi:hypothetical protein
LSVTTGLNSELREVWGMAALELEDRRSGVDGKAHGDPT